MSHGGSKQPHTVYTLVTTVPGTMLVLTPIDHTEFTHNIIKLPPQAFEMDCFYMEPLTIGDNRSLGMQPSPVERTSSSMVKNMFADAGIAVKTNHSLRATGASEMFCANVSEKVVQGIAYVREHYHQQANGCISYTFIFKRRRIR